ncbi:hypothetical protein P8452_35514 [Trifolium repens]|nr:hypothetical protein P8452_35514 [Trifolium repens]
MAGHFLLIMFLLSLTPPFIVHSQKNNQLGFISIDCGLVDKPSYTDETTSIYYTWDVNFTDTGVSKSISSKHKASLERQFWNVKKLPKRNKELLHTFCFTRK